MPTHVSTQHDIEHILAKKFAHRPYPLASDDERAAHAIAQAVTHHARSGEPLAIWVVSAGDEAERLIAHKIRETLDKVGIARNRLTLSKRARCTQRAPTHSLMLIPDITTGVVANDLFARGDQPVLPFSLTIIGVGQAAVPIMETILQRERTLAPSEPNDQEVMAEIMRQVTVPPSCQEFLQMDRVQVILRNKIHHKLYRSGSRYEQLAVSLVKDFMEQHTLMQDDLLDHDQFAGVKACFGGDHELWRQWLPVEGIEMLGAPSVFLHWHS